MGSIGRYIFRTTLGAFVLVLVGLTAAIWLTQALRDVDLMTNQGQSALVFLGITSLVIPPLILVIAPVALVVAVAHSLHRLGTDSEIIVMNGAGMKPWRLLQPFLAVTLVASIMLIVNTAYVAPESMRSLRRWLTEVRTDLVSNIVQPGRFTAIEQGLAFNIRERRANGLLVGIMLDDRRDPSQRVTIIAERGEIVKNDNGNFLLLESGSIQRHESNQRDPNIVQFDRYAFDLSQFASSQTVRYTVRERYLWELLKPSPSDQLAVEQPGQFRAELHDRILAPIYPIAFMLIAFAFLGAPRTTRQSAAWSIGGVILAVATLRLSGFAFGVLSIKHPAAIAFQYLAIVAVTAGSLAAIGRGIIIEPPAVVVRTVDAVIEWLSSRAGMFARTAQ
jgi:lipopolysaccharide export system permease protein